MHVWSCTKIFPRGKNKVVFNTSSFSEESTSNTPCVCAQACSSSCSTVTGSAELVDTTTRAGISSCSRKQNLVHVYTEILSRPGCAATSTSLSSIHRVHLTSMMVGDKNCNFALCKMSQIDTFHNVIHDVLLSSFQNKKRKQTVEPAQYGLEINFKTSYFNTVYKIDT